MDFAEKIEAWFSEHPQRLPYSLEKLPGVATVTKRRPGDYYESTMTEDAFVSDYWRIGGQTGGSCWDEGPHRYRGLEGEQESEFTSLNSFLEEHFPQLTFLQYKRIASLIKYEEFTDDRDYYGNYTVNMVKYLMVEDLKSVLDAL